MVKLALGETDEASSPDALKGALAEFISLFLFVFIGVGSVMSYEKIHPGEMEAGGLLVIALAHGFALAILVAMTANISGGHVNPAVSLGLALAGKITVIRLVLYWVAQLLGAAAGAWGVEGRHHRRGRRRSRHRRWHDCLVRRADGDHPHLHARVRGVRHRRGPQEGHGGCDRPLGHRLHGPCPDLRGCSFQRRLDEPRTLLRPGARVPGLPQPLGILGGTLHRRRAGCAHLRRGVHLGRGAAGTPARRHHRVLEKKTIFGLLRKSET